MLNWIFNLLKLKNKDEIEIVETHRVSRKGLSWIN